MRTSHRFFAALLAVLLGAISAGQDTDARPRRKRAPNTEKPKQNPEEKPKNEAALKKPEKKTSDNERDTGAELEIGPEDGEVEAVAIRLRDVVHSALKFSPALKRAEFDWKSAQLEVGRKNARFSPILSGQVGGRSERLYNEYATNASESIRTIHTASAEASLASRIRTGATYSITAKAGRIDEATNSFLRPITPIYVNELSSQITQPLLRGRGYAANAANVDRELATTELLQAQGQELRLAIALQAVSSYWVLVLRREELEILRNNVAEAVTLKEIVKRRVRVGQDAQSSIVQADAAVAIRMQAVEAARVGIVDAERALMGDAYLHESKLVEYSQVPVPTEKVNEEVPSVNFQKELSAALEHRPEAVRMREELKVAKLEKRIASDLLRPRLDLYGTAGILGFAGTPGVDTPELLQGGIGSSIQNLAGFKAPFFEIGVMFEIPLGNVDAKNAYKQSEIAISRAKMQNVSSRIALDIRAALQRVRIAGSSLDAAKESLRLSEENVRAMKLRYEGGGTTLFDVTRSQDEVTQAKARIAVARAQIEVAKAGLEAAQGTLLKRFGVDERFGKH